MNWIKENKFLTGFLAALVAGAAALVYFIVSSQASFTEVSDNYQKQAQELARLQNLVPYPDEANLKLLRGKKDEYSAMTSKLVKDLSAAQFPLEPMMPAEFQDVLKKTVDDVVGKSSPGLLPQRFYLGFDVYQTKPPGGPKAAAALARELKAIEFVVSTLIDSKVSSIADIKRFPLFEEDSKAADNQKSPVIKSTFEVTFSGEQGRLRKALDDIVSSKKQFYIIRSLSVKNEREKGPSRSDSLVSANPAQGEEAQRLKIIVGTEKLTVTARIEIVNFAPPATK